MKEKQLIATRAAIIKDKKILVIREAAQYEEGTNEGKYDLPGGRVDMGESIHDALRREAKEETGLDVEAGRPFFVGEWHPVVKDARLHITAIFFVCSIQDGEVTLGEDHDAYKWIGKHEVTSVPFVDTVPEALDTLISLDKL